MKCEFIQMKIQAHVVNTNVKVGTRSRQLSHKDNYTQTKTKTNTSKKSKKVLLQATLKSLIKFLTDQEKEAGFVHTGLTIIVIFNHHCCCDDDDDDDGDDLYK